MKFYLSSELCEVLDNFTALPHGWDGYGADEVEAQIIANAKDFLSVLLQEFPTVPITGDSLSPTPYGSIVVDLETGKGGLVSVEIGKEHIGYFTKYKGDTPDIISDIEPCDFLHISPLLRQAISNLL